MVRVVINHDIVGIPQPPIHVADIIRRDAPSKRPKPEEAGASAAQMPNVAAADSTAEVPVFPGMIEMIVGIVAAGVVTDPLTVGVNVRQFGMPLFIVELLVFSRMFWRAWRGFSRSRTTLGNVSAANFWFAAMLFASPSLLRYRRQADQ